MKSFTRKKTILFAVAFTLVLAIQGVAAAPQQLPNPILAFLGEERAEVGGRQTVRYRFEVTNRDKYPAEMFAAAPNLPPCGQNTKSSRTWVDIYDLRGKRLHAFCVFTKPGDLEKLWFALDTDTIPPSWVYIELTDRQTGTKYKSNLAETTN